MPSTIAPTLRRTVAIAASPGPAFWNVLHAKTRSQCSRPGHPRAHRIWRRGIGLAFREVAHATRFCGGRSFESGRLDPEATTMRRLPAQNLASRSVDLVSLAECVEQFSSKTVVLLGDFVADELRFGEISRVSREAPVLILKHRETQLVPGGGANAANNLASLGARVLPVAAVGADSAGDALIAHFRRKRINVSGIVRVKGWTTPTKSRFLAGWAHTTAQQVLRVDYEPQSPLPD